MGKTFLIHFILACWKSTKTRLLWKKVIKYAKRAYECLTKIYTTLKWKEKKLEIKSILGFKIVTKYDEGRCCPITTMNLKSYSYIVSFSYGSELV